MRLLYIWDADYPWDVRTRKICLSLAENGHDVHILARNNSWQPIDEALEEGNVHRIKPMRYLGRRLDNLLSFPAFFSPRWFSRLVEVIRETSPDVLIVRDLPLCPTAIKAGRKSGLPVVLDMAENYPAMMQDIWEANRQKPWDILVRNPRLVRKVENYCIEHVDHVVVVVEESGNRLQSLGVSADKISVVSNTPSKKRLALSDPVMTRKESQLRLVYLGLMEIPRGIGDVLEALALVKENNKADVSLVLIGDGRDKALFERQAQDLHLDHGEVSFLGYVENERALAEVAKADVGLIPHHANESWNTTIPNKLFDYMAAGLAVLSSDAIPCVRVLEETKAGLTFPSGDSKAIMHRILELNEGNTCRELGLNGKSAVTNNYNWEKDLAVMERLLLRIQAR